MNRQKIGQILFWIGVVFTIVWQVLTWYQSPIQRVHTSEELSRTIHAIWGPLFTLRIIGGGGITFSLLGALIYTSKKGSYIWLLAFLPNMVNFLMYWDPSQHAAWLFGVGGAIILLSYFGILWYWIRTHDSYQDAIKRGKLIQLLGITVLVVEGNLLCMYFGNPHQIALVDLPLPSPEVLNLTLALGMLLLFLGHYVTASGSGEEGR